MSRTTIYKIQYIAVLATCLIGGLAAYPYLRSQPLSLLLFVAVLLLPGRIQGYLWRDLLLGRRLSELGDHERSVQHSKLFLRSLKQRPWVRGLWWLSWSMYTRDAKAMALNNLAASQLNLQQWDAAETSLNEAAALDPLYPMPQLNLAVLYTAKGDAAKAQEHQQRAKDLGLRGDKVDSVIQSMGRLYASYQTQM